MKPSEYEERMNQVLDLYNRYTHNDRMLIISLLKEEIEYCWNESVYSVPMELCAFMLYKIFNIDDIYLFYSAKFETSFDASFELDIELIFGLDKDETKQYLLEKKTDKRKNKKLLKAIQVYENRNYKTREDYISYFETQKIQRLLSYLP